MKAFSTIQGWQYNTVHNSACLVRVPRSTLRPLNADVQPEIKAGRIAYVAAAARVVEVLEGSTSATDGHVLRITNQGRL